MKKVKFIGNDVIYGLVKGQVYDVVRYIFDETIFDEICLKVSEGRVIRYYFNDSEYKPLFINFTSEYRDEVIDSILE